MNTNLRWVGALVSLGVVVSAVSCSGDQFCADSRTCPSSQSAAGQGGSGDSELPVGGADAVAGSSSDMGGQPDVTPGSAGAAGAPPSTVGNPCTTDAEC